MSKIMTAEEVARRIPDGATIAFPGTASILVVDALLAAIERRFLAEGHPRDLTAFEPCNAAITPSTGIDRFAHEGMTRRVIASAFPPFKGNRIMPMLLDGRIQAYNFPMGVLYSLMREIGAGRPGLISEVGLESFVDPKYEGGKVNARTTEDLVERIELGGRTYLHYKAHPVHVTLLKATTADAAGNLTMEREPLTLGVLSLAIAAKASGGKVYAQVERIAERGTLHPHRVAVPGALIDGVVLAPDAMQSEIAKHDPTITGEQRIELPREPVPAGPNRVILARAAAHLRAGWLINTGVGLASEVPRLLLECGIEDRIAITTEHGAFGGLPTRLPTFGAHQNAEAVVDPNDMFNLYTGGGLSACFLGLAEADGAGNVNVSKFAGRLSGVGGFMDITVRTPHLFICGSFAAAGAEVAVEDGRVRVAKEGSKAKLVRDVQHLTLSGRHALGKGQTVAMITERALFRLTPAGWEAAELAPGIEPERDLQPMMEFPLRLAPDAKTYPPEALWPAGRDFSAWLARMVGER